MHLAEISNQHSNWASEQFINAGWLDTFGIGFECLVDMVVFFPRESLVIRYRQ